MSLIRWPVLLLILTASAVSQAQVPTDDPAAANRALVETFVRAWNSHDMTIFDRIVTDDVDWVNVDGGHGQGREQVVGGHARVHATPKFADSVMTINRVEVALVRPDVAIVHIAWGLRGDRDNDGTPRQPREGVFTWTTVRDASGWRIRASHNSNRQTVR